MKKIEKAESEDWLVQQAQELLESIEKMNSEHGLNFDLEAIKGLEAQEFIEAVEDQFITKQRKKGADSNDRKKPFKQTSKNPEPLFKVKPIFENGANFISLKIAIKKLSESVGVEMHLSDLFEWMLRNEVSVYYKINHNNSLILTPIFPTNEYKISAKEDRNTKIVWGLFCLDNASYGAKFPGIPSDYKIIRLHINTVSELYNFIAEENIEIDSPSLEEYPYYILATLGEVIIYDYFRGKDTPLTIGKFIDLYEDEADESRIIEIIDNIPVYGRYFQRETMHEYIEDRMLNTIQN